MEHFGTPNAIATSPPISPLAGLPAKHALLFDLAEVERAYYQAVLEPSDPAQSVKFSTSGHSGSSLRGTFTEAHIRAITQAICDYRTALGITGPLFMGRDTHALSVLAFRTVLEVLAGNGVDTVVQSPSGATPAPAISRAILTHTCSHPGHCSDGIILTSCVNPPEDGGIRYNAPDGGPADTEVTRWIEHRANALLAKCNVSVKLTSFAKAIHADSTHQCDLVMPYVRDLSTVIDMDAIRGAGLRLAADPLGGAAWTYWEPISSLYKVNITVVNTAIDPAFSFMTVDRDGQIRIDCSSPYAVTRLIRLQHRYDIGFATDPDADRHGIVTPSAGLLDPNHYLAVAISYLLGHRPKWPVDAAIGKTLVNSSIIDLVVRKFGRLLSEVPVGFKWFTRGLVDGTICFAGDDSAGASFMRKDGTVWAANKDGLIMCLLAAEITATTDKDPGEHYRALTSELGAPCYARVDSPATTQLKEQLQRLSVTDVKESTLAGEQIVAKLTRAPANLANIGGIKVVAPNGWFAATPSDTREVYKIYAESFKGQGHLNNIIREAQDMLHRSRHSAAR